MQKTAFRIYTVFVWHICCKFNSYKNKNCKFASWYYKLIFRLSWGNFCYEFVQVHKNLIMLSIFTYLCYLNRLINKLYLIRVGIPSLRDRNANIRTFTSMHTGTNSFEPKVCFKGVMMMKIMMRMMMINVFLIWLTKERRLALFSAGAIVRDPRHRGSQTRSEQDLNLRRTLV